MYLVLALFVNIFGGADFSFSHSLRVNVLFRYYVCVSCCMSNFFGELDWHVVFS